MTVTITPVDNGTVAGDGTGEFAFDAFESVNANEANLKAAVEALQGRYFTIQNSSTTVALGKRYMSNNHAGITLTMPAVFAVSATDYSDIQLVNADDASNITLTPASGDAFFVDGATNGVDTTYAITPGNLVILSPRTTDSEWDLLVVGGGGGWADMTEAVWAGGTQSEVADGASAVAFDFDTDNTYSTSGAKLASWSNNSTEKAYIDKDGQLRLDPGMSYGITSGIAFGDGDTVIYESADDVLKIRISGADTWQLFNSYFQSLTAFGAYLQVGTGSSTDPIFAFNSDTNTGVGRAGTDQLSLIAGGVEALRLSEAASHVLITHELEAGITAFATGGQANATLLTSSYNEISTCATTADSVKLPDAVAGLKVTIINNGAAACDVFPNTSDNLGAGADTAVSLPSGSNITYFAYDATNWESI